MKPFFACIASLLAVLSFAPLSLAQDPAPLPTQLENAGFEQGEVGQPAPGWRFWAGGKATTRLDDQEPAEGLMSGLVDASERTGSAFSNLSQTLDATPWRGKRVRFRAAVRTAELSNGGRAQLWFRVDRPNRQMGGFDNMDDRPIRGDQWQHHAIVLDVAPDAERLVLGMLVLGKGKAWLDDASLAEVGRDEPTTGRSAPAARPRFDPRIEKAMREAADAPQQPFWTWWLLLPAVAVGLFVIGLWPPARSSAPAEPPIEMPRREMGAIRWFALRFAIAYWLLYALPSPFASILSGTASLLPDPDPPIVAAPGEGHVGLNEAIGHPKTALLWLGGRLAAWHAEYDDETTKFTGRLLFDLEREQIVPPLGSGDTTMGYLTILNTFVFAFGIAVLWSIVARLRGRNRGRDVAVDLLRSYLRYVLAFAMLGYGLAKVSMTGNQFPELTTWRLERTWGETSPMGVVWAFMGASRPYTMFAGLAEVLGAVLLIWRNTSMLGAMVTTAVMTNVVLLNFCYDVPVKIYSFHLLLMAVLILVPDARRLLNLFLLNRNPTDPGTPSAFRGRILPWIRWPLKLWVIGVCFGLPLYTRGVELFEYYSRESGGTSAQAEAERDHLLQKRGFRWINEVPFNR